MNLYKNPDEYWQKTKLSKKNSENVPKNLIFLEMAILWSPASSYLKMEHEQPILISYLNLILSTN